MLTFPTWFQPYVHADILTFRTPLRVFVSETALWWRVIYGKSMGRVITQNTIQSSFWDFRLSFWFSLKASKAQMSVWKIRSRFLKQIFDLVFCQKEFLVIWPVKSTVGIMHWNTIWLIILIYILTVEAIP